MRVVARAPRRARGGASVAHGRQGMSFNMPNVGEAAAQMAPAGGDTFGTWYNMLPPERQFSYSDVPVERRADYEAWKGKHGFTETADYDLAGAFLSGQEPVMVREDSGEVRPHLGSRGVGGKMLKSPRHETFWKGALAEMVYEQEGEAALDKIPWDKLKTPAQAEAWFFGDRDRSGGNKQRSWEAEGEGGSPPHPDILDQMQERQFRAPETLTYKPKSRFADQPESQNVEQRGLFEYMQGKTMLDFY